MQFIESKPNFSNKCHGWNKLKIGKICILISVVILVGVLIGYQTTRNDELNAKLQKQEQKIFNQSELLKNITKNLEDHQQSLDNHAGKLDFHYRASSAENCDELFEHGINVSGAFNIDPDGRYHGMHSFEVICDFEKNVTRIQPKKNLIKLSKSSKVVQYSARMDQIRYLIEHSGSCYQEILVQDASLQDVVWLDFKGRERNLSNGFEGKVQLWNFWLLPITGVGLKSQITHNDNTSVTYTIGDLTCSQTIYFNISGSVYDAFPDVGQNVSPSSGRSIEWKPRKVPATFNIEFDIEVVEWKSEKDCNSFLFFLVEKLFSYKPIPIIRYCASDKVLRIEHSNQYGSVTTTEIDLSSAIGKSPQHVQVKKFIPDGSTTFYYVKFGQKILYNGESERIWNHKDELYIGIYSLYENDGARVTNLKITE